MPQISVTPQTAPPRLHFNVPPKPSHLLRARERLRDYLRQYCADRQVIDDVVLCVEEGATNAIRHSGTEQAIEISVRFEDGDLVAEVKDHGQGFDVTAFDRESPPDPSSDHGRGLFLISRLCDEMELRIDGGFELRMVKTAVAPSQPALLEGGVATLHAAGNLDHRDLRQLALLEEIDEGFIALDWEYRYVHANHVAVHIMQRPLGEMLGHTPWELFPELQGGPLQERYRQAIELGRPSVAEHRSVVSGDWHEVRIYPTPAGASAYYRQINERKRAELERETTIGFLRLINESDSLVALVRVATTFFQQRSGCEAVGIRLRDGDDYPYFEARGFPEQFDATQEFFSETGSFWSNNTTELLATSSEEDRQARTLDRCNNEGYESVALIALRAGEERLGLLQLNDRRIGRFTPEDIALWERLADQLAVTIGKMRLEEELQRSQQERERLLEREGTALQQLDGERSFLGRILEELPYPTSYIDRDLVYRRCNSASAATVGLTPEQLVGRTVESVIGADSEGIGRLRGVLESGEPYAGTIEFTAPGSSTMTYFRVTYVPDKDEHGHVVGVLTNAVKVTDFVEAQAQAEQQLQTTTELLGLARALSSRIDLGELLSVLTDVVISTSTHSRAFIALWDEDRRQLRVGASRGEGAPPVDFTASFDEASAATREAVETKRTVVADFASLPPEDQGTSRRWDSRFALLCPVAYQARLLGLIVIDDHGERREFSEREIHLVEGIAAQAAVAIENARLLERETKAARLDEGPSANRTTRLVGRFRGHRWRVLVGAIAIQSATLAALNTAHDPRHVLGLPGSMIALISVLAGALAGPLVGALVAAAGGGVFYLTVGGQGSQSTVLTTMISTAIWVTAGLLSGFLAKTLSEQAERRRAAAVALVRADAAREAQLAEQARIEELAAGLQVQTENLQAAGEELQAQSDELQEQNDELVARHHQLAERAMHVSLLKDLAEVGASSRGAAESAQRQVEMLMRTLNARTVFLFVGDDAGQHLVPLALAGVNEEHLEQHAGPIAVAGEGAIARVFRTRQPSFIRDVASDPTLSESGRAFTLSLGQHSGASLPLLVRDEAIGCLALAWAEPHAFDSDEVSFLESIAFEVALGLENARLFEREAEVASLAAALNEMNGLINSTLDGREIMQTVVEQAVAAVGADSAMVALRHGDDWVAEYGYPEVPGVIHESVRSDEVPFMIAAVEQRRPIVIDDCEADRRCIPEVQRRFGVRSVLCLPLIVREEVLGVIFFNHHKAAVAFPPAIVEFASKLVASISTALANARLYEEQQRIATTLQENFLHELPTVAGLELGVVTKTAFEPELVGGDFSDVFVVDDTHVVVLIGDVAGKGVHAAGLTETVRSTVRALAAVDSSPAFILAKANELLLRYDPEEAHVTAFLAVLDPHTGHLNYASAGHPAPVHLGAFTCRTLDVAFGPPLGTFKRPYEDAHAMLTLEDYLVLYTDGVTEARQGAELLGEQRLVEIVAGLRGRSAQEAAEGVRDAVLAFAGQLHDDLQVVALRLA